MSALKPTPVHIPTAPPTVPEPLPPLDRGSALPAITPVDPAAFLKTLQDHILKEVESKLTASGLLPEKISTKTAYRAFLRSLLYWLAVVIACLVVAILDHSWTVMIVVILCVAIPLIGIVENAGDSGKRDLEAKLNLVTAQLKSGTDLLTSPLQIPALISQIADKITKAIKEGK